MGGRSVRIEPLEYLIQRLIRDARAGIFNNDQHPVLTPPRPDTHRVAIITKRDGIADKVNEHLRQTPFEPTDGNRFSREVGDELDPLFRSLLTKEITQVGQGCDEIELFFLFLDQFAVQPRGVGNVADQTVKAPNVMIDHVQQLFAMLFFLDHPQGADGRAQRCKRVLDLMADIGRKLFVGVDPVIQGGHHPSHCYRQATNLIRPSGQIGNADTAGCHLACVTVTAQLGSSGQI